MDGLLQLARLESAPAANLTAAPLDLVAMVRDLAGTYHERAAALGIRLTWNIPETAMRCQITPEHLRQIVSNLLDNALHFTPANQRIFLELARDQTTENTARLVVRDEGQGIEPQILPKIFERFFTTGNPRTGVRGTGLGLALVRSLAEIARGTVTAESRPGEGSVFTVRLPLA